MKASVDIKAAYLLAVRGELGAMRSATTRIAPASLERVVLEAAIAQNEGRMDRCRALYRRALDIATDKALPYVVDLIAPTLVMDGDLERYETLRAACVLNAEQTAVFAAMDAVVSSFRGDSTRSLTQSQSALDFVADSDDDALVGRILQRLAYAALRRRDFAQAVELAARSARTLEAIGAYRPAATAYSIAYNVHHAGTGDTDRAEVYAGKIVEAARRSGDAALENVGLIAQYEMACECGEIEIAQPLRNRIDALALPEQYAERFARGIGDVILSAVHNDGAAFYANAVLLRDFLATDRPAMALASALRSLGAAAVGDFHEARVSSRNALGLAAISDRLEAAYSTRYRKLARALAASTCVLIGDNVRAQRKAPRDAAEDQHGLFLLVRIAHGAQVEDVPRRIRGYARMITTVRESIRQSFRQWQLSEAENAVLKLLAQGMSAPQIAQHTGRSVHTIRAHTRSIIDKFEVRGRSAAIAHALKNGLLNQ